MADRESILRWLGEKKYRVVPESSPGRRIVERLVAEGRAAWLGAANRVRVVQPCAIADRIDAAVSCTRCGVKGPPGACDCWCNQCWHETHAGATCDYGNAGLYCPCPKRS